MSSDQDPSSPSRSGYVAIVGRPNVGKSTLLNHLLGQKISITSRKPQTTRHQILGVKTLQQVQIVYVDTPGIHGTTPEASNALNRYMNRAAESVLHDVDLVLFVVDRTIWTAEDEQIVEKLKPLKCPVFCVLNKIDLLADKSQLLPALAALSSKYEFAEIVPLSAQNLEQVGALEKFILARIPAGQHYFPADQITDRSERFLAAELIREKIMRRMGEEVPYQVAVEIESFKLQGQVTHIDALILVQRNGQKKMLIGQKGEQLKSIGRDARIDMEKLFDTKVMLRLWVKVKSGWADDERALRSLGYNDF